MKDFCNVAERDCIRLIIAQDLKQSGIDIDSSNLENNFSASNMTHINTSYSNNCHYHNNSSHHHNHSRGHHLSTNNNILNTSINTSNTNNFLNKSSTNYKHNNGSSSIVSSNMIDMNNQHDSQIITSTRVFGIDLRQLEMVNINVNDQLLTVPSFLKYVIEYILEYTTVEGIFRRNGTASRLKELKKQVEEGVYNFSQFAIFDMTSLVKLFFRELPESLLTFPLYSNFIKAAKLESPNPNAKVESILNLCLQLPDINLHVLIYLMNFLKKITLQESLNKMNSFNLAVCFAPNIIYTRINKSNDLYINEERVVVQLLIENSSLIGKISDSVYERSVMLNSLCCSTSLNPNCSLAANNTNNNSNLSNSVNPNNTNNNNSNNNNIMTSNQNNLNNNTKNMINSNNETSNNTFNTNPNTISSNNDLMFLYDNDLQENSSFAHHIQSAGSTSLSSYCGSSSNSKKEKKKRRSSSLKELMNTIQNSISKFRRRSASEKNDKTTYSIITCTSMTSASSSTNCGDTMNCSNRYDDKQKLIDTPFINASQNGKQLATPMCANFYATPRINKRNAEESLQSTTKKKLMEKLPQRNLLLPNAPITPFSTTKKSKHPLKQLLSAAEKPFKFQNIFSPDIRFAEAPSTLLPNPASAISGTNHQDKLLNSNNTTSSKIVEQMQKDSIKASSTNGSNNQIAQTPLINQKQIVQQTPLIISNSSQNQLNNPNLHKQLKYEDSPSSLMINQSCDFASFKPKYQHQLEKNLSLNHDHECRRRLEMIPSSSGSSSCSSKHHHHHHHSHNHHHHHHSYSSSHYSSSSSHHKHSSKDHHHHHHHHSDRKKQHQYVNAMPPNSLLTTSSSSHRNNRYINQSELCTQIISGNLNSKSTSDQNLQSNDLLSFSSSMSSTSSSSSSSATATSGSGSSSEKYSKTNHCCPKVTNGASISICTSTLQSTANNSNLNSADNSMRCTLKRGRPNTPKTGLSVEYRIRKSSVPNTPECKNIPISTRANNTISNDDIQVKSRSKSNAITSSVSSTSLNTAMVLDHDDDNADKISIITTNSVHNKENNDDLNDARLLDMAFTGDEEIEDEDAEFECDENVCEIKIENDVGNQEQNDSDSSSKCASPKLNSNRQLSLSLSNLHHECDNNEDLDTNEELCNRTTVSDSTTNDLVLLHRKSLSADVLLNEIDRSHHDSNLDESKIELIKKNEQDFSEMSIKNESVDSGKETTKNPIIEEQQKLIHFEPFEFKLPTSTSTSNINNSFEAILDHQQKLIQQNQNNDLNMLQSCLRRQSLFKLKETINGKVSKQVSEIEQRKLSPYRFSNSPLKLKKFKDSSSSLNSARKSKSIVSPIRVPSIFCKRILQNTPREQYIIKNKSTISEKNLNDSNSSNGLSPSKLICESNNSPLIVKSSDRFFRKMTRNRSVKRLNGKVSNQVSSNLSSISENETTLSTSEDKSKLNTTNNKSQAIGSPIGKNLIVSKELKCSTESIDL